MFVIAVVSDGGCFVGGAGGLLESLQLVERQTPHGPPVVVAEAMWPRQRRSVVVVAPGRRAW